MQDGALLRIYIAESAKINNLPGYSYLAAFFLRKGFAGCTVMRGMGGFGHEHMMRSVDVFRLSLDLPVIIDVVDSRRKIESILPEVEAMVNHGLVIVQEVKMSNKSPDTST